MISTKARSSHSPLPFARRPRTPGYLYGAIALALMVLVAVIALTARQPPPPTIAEFAPQALEQIRDAPSEQSSEFGNEAGECPPGQVCAPGVEESGSAGGAAPIDVPRVRKCVGDPPRQIEDPQSPPCVPYWEGDNGGATWRGVTANEIRLAIGFSFTDKYMRSQVPSFLAFFNRRFEFYGRKLRIELFPCGEDSPTGMLADAERVDEELRAFASVHYCDRHFQESVYYDELARRKILSVDMRPTVNTEDHFVEWHPYQWNYQPSFDVVSRNLGAWTCTSLKGRPARFADGVQQDRPRKFGIVYESRPDGFAPDVDPLVKHLNDCGIDAPAVDIRENHEGAMVQFMNSGITSVICLCDAPPTTAATGQGYFPEWLVTILMTSDGDLIAQLNQPTQQMDQVVGQWWWNKQLTPPDSPWHWALSDDPSFSYQEPPLDYYDARNIYSSLLVLASGIQLAGPELTPQTFAEGLQKARFPNPGAGGPPYYQAHIGFGPRDHTAQNDAALSWWDDNADSSWGSRQGAWCYFNSGRRMAVGRGAFPADDSGLFEGPCY